MFDICFVDGVDDVIEYHVKAENTFNHFIDGMLFGNMLKNHSVNQLIWRRACRKGACWSAMR